MTKKLVIILFVFFASAGIGHAQENDKSELRILNDLQVNYNELSGPGRAASSLTEDTTYVESLEVYARGNNEDLRYVFRVGGRTTNDKRYDPAEFALTSLKGELDYHAHNLQAGDLFESYSQYSLDSSLKGTAYKYIDDTDNLPDLSLVYGAAYARWENLWDGYDLETVKREVFGANISHDFSPVFNLGASAVNSNDSNRIYSTDVLYENTVYAMDFEYNPIPGLTIRGEGAFSQTDEDSGVDYGGNAQKIEAIGDAHPSRVVLRYERFSPKFKASVGSAMSDQERFTSSWRYKYSKFTTTNLRFLWLRNHINGSPQMTHTWQPQANISMRNLLGRKYGVTTLAYKLERKNGADLSTLNQYASLSHRDRFGKLENTTTLGVNKYETDGGVRDQMDYTANTTFHARLRAGKVVFKPEMSAGSFFYENQLIGQTNQVLQYSAGLGLDIPDKKIFSKVTAGINQLHAFGQDNSDKWFTRFHIYYRPSFSKYIKRCTFSLRGAINDYSFSTTTRDFREKSISLGINIPFSIK